MDLQGRRSGLRRCLAPQIVDQPAARDDLVRVQEEEGEQGALLGPAERERATLIERLQRPQDPELHLHPRVEGNTVLSSVNRGRTVKRHSAVALAAALASALAVALGATLGLSARRPLAAKR